MRTGGTEGGGGREVADRARESQYQVNGETMRPAGPVPRPLSRPKANACRPDLAHLLHDGELLRADEGLEAHADGEVDVVAAHGLAQVHACVRLGHADDGLDVAHGDRDGPRRQRLAAQLAVQPRNLVLVHVVQLGPHAVLGVHDVLAQQVLRNELCGLWTHPPKKDQTRRKKGSHV